MRSTVTPWVGVTLMTACAACVPAAAAAQQTVGDVLSFLLTNRSIPTDDFVRDEEAAASTRDSLSDLLLLELATLPVSGRPPVDSPTV